MSEKPIPPQPDSTHDQTSASEFSLDTLWTPEEIAQRPHLYVEVGMGGVNTVAYTSAYFEQSDARLMGIEPSDKNLDPSTFPEAEYPWFRLVQAPLSEIAPKMKDQVKQVWLRNILSEARIRNYRGEILEPIKHILQPGGEVIIIESYFDPQKLGRDLSGDIAQIFPKPEYQTEPLDLQTDENPYIAGYRNSQAPESIYVGTPAFFAMRIKRTESSAGDRQRYSFSTKVEQGLIAQSADQLQKMESLIDSLIVQVQEDLRQYRQQETRKGHLSVTLDLQLSHVFDTVLNRLQIAMEAKEVLATYQGPTRAREMLEKTALTRDQAQSIILSMIDKLKVAFSDTNSPQEVEAMLVAHWQTDRMAGIKQNLGDWDPFAQHD